MLSELPDHPLEIPRRGSEIGGPRRLLSIGRPRTANLAGRHGTSAVVRLCAWFEGNSPRLPALSNGFPGQCVLPTPEGATAATSMARRQGGQTGQVRTWRTGLWVACPGSRAG